MNKTLRLITPKKFKFRSRNLIIDKQVHHKQQRQNMTCNNSVPVKVNKTSKASSKLSRFQTLPSSLSQQSETLKELRYISAQSLSKNFLSDFNLIAPIKVNPKKCSASLNRINTPCSQIQKAVKLKQSFNKKRDIRFGGGTPLISTKKKSNRQLFKALHIRHKSIENTYVSKIKQRKFLEKGVSSSHQKRPQRTKENWKTEKKQIVDNDIGPW